MEKEEFKTRDELDSEEEDAVRDPTEPNVFPVKKINKRTIGMVMVKRCGNEGYDGSPDQKEIRTLLQGAITFFEKQSDGSLARKWENAELKIYSSGETLVIRSGECTHKYVVEMDGYNEVYCTELKPRSCFIL